MANFYHLDLSGGKSGFSLPTYWVLVARDKKLVGPFKKEKNAKEYRASLMCWPPARIIEGCSAYGLDSENWENSLPGWERTEPPLRFVRDECKD